MTRVQYNKMENFSRTFEVKRRTELGLRFHICKLFSKRGARTQKRAVLGFVFNCQKHAGRGWEEKKKRSKNARSTGEKVHAGWNLFEYNYTPWKLKLKQKKGKKLSTFSFELPNNRNEVLIYDFLAFVNFCPIFYSIFRSYYVREKSAETV